MRERKVFSCNLASISKVTQTIYCFLIFFFLGLLLYREVPDHDSWKASLKAPTKDRRIQTSVRKGDVNLLALDHLYTPAVEFVLVVDKRIQFKSLYYANFCLALTL